MNAPDYLSLLRQENHQRSLQGGTAQTAKTTLRSLCSSPPARKNQMFSRRADVAAPARRPQALPTDATDPSDLISDYAERIAICSEVGDVVEDDAHRIASEQCDATLDELAARQGAYWCQRIEALPEPSDHRLIKIVPACRSVLTERWLIDAIRLGWTDADLFGLDSGAPRAYFGNGVVASIALTALCRPVRIVAVDNDFVTVETGTRSKLQHHRRNCRGRPIWEHPAFARVRH
jgi:hypothetical protein